VSPIHFHSSQPLSFLREGSVQLEFLSWLHVEEGHAEGPHDANDEEHPRNSSRLRHDAKEFLKQRPDARLQSNADIFELSPKVDKLRDEVIALRKQNLSIHDISRTLEDAGSRLSPAAVSLVLKEEGFARLPRRKDDERPPGTRPELSAVADVHHLDLSLCRFRTRFGGLFLFLPYLARIPFDQLVEEAGFDEGLALFAGLNRTPKRAFLTDYSCRIDPVCYPKLLNLWFDAMGTLGLSLGNSFDLDFHTIPFHGEDALVEKHYVSKRSRRQKGILAFLVQDADSRAFCYANADVRKSDQNDEILRFVDFRKERTGTLPGELIFDSKLTTYANLNRINQMGIHATYDETISRMLNVLEEVNREVPLTSWFFDHCETISDRSLERVRALGGGIAIRDRIAFQGEYFLDRFRRQAAERTPPLRKMLELGIPVGAGTDATRVASYNPCLALYWLVAGKTVRGASLYSEKIASAGRRPRSSTLWAAAGFLARVARKGHLPLASWRT
jgi:hypothetical protein